VTRHAAPATTQLRAGPGAVVLPCALMGLTAATGAVGLASDGLDLGARVRDRLPWDSPVLAGAALFVLVGLPMFVAAWAGARRRPATGDLTTLAGALLVGWIVGQVAVLATFSWFQPLCLLYGAVLVVLGRLVDRSRDRGPR
ncbi:Hypothetical protein KLENKIAIHU_4364, partial [Klenkia terrae]